MPTNLDKLYALHSQVFSDEKKKKKKTSAKPAATQKTRRTRRSDKAAPSTHSRPRGHFQNLPTETVVQVLEYLPAQDVIVFRGVCAAFRNVVDGSLALQYKIECFVSGVVEGTLAARDSLKDRLASVREWREAWRTMRWTDERDAGEVPEFAMSHASGSVYAIGGNALDPAEGDKSIVFRQLGSKLRGVPAKQWTVDELPEFDAFAIDHEEDLLVLAVPQGDTKELNIHFLSSTTGQPHPSAARPILALTTHETMADETGFWLFSAFACESLVGVTAICDNMAIVHNEVWIVDWKRDEVIMNAHAKTGKKNVEPLDFQFFDERHLIVTSAGKNMDAVMLFDCLNVPNTRTVFKDMVPHALVVLGLPKLARKVEYSLNSISCKPRRSSDHKYRDAAKFHQAVDAPAVLVTMHLPDKHDDERRFDLIIPGSVWLSCLHDAEKQGVLVPWEDWGMESRLFDASDAVAGQVVGTRYLTSEPFMTRESRSGMRAQYDNLVVYDFAPVPRLMHALATEGEEAEVCVFTHVVEDRAVWAQPVRTAAPFRRYEVPASVADDGGSVTLVEDGLFARNRFELGELKANSI
ncbi:F-box protein [Phanerochaete sordida]|uniref:F-box protein n=1 Tax=Phanerochaete sordida TaxID=48140 RepID=A0A9P3LGL3_9APHY|nr:F-box protein [Phanerochaete sordida]